MACTAIGLLHVAGCGSTSDGSSASTPYDVLMVLGTPANADGSPSAEQVRRVDNALRLTRAGFAHDVIFSGAAAHNEWVEAEVMASYAIEQGLDPARVVLEPDAFHTDENIRNSSALMRERGWTQAVIVSNPFHLYFQGVCDANCVARAGRASWAPVNPDDRGEMAALDYLLYPDANPVTRSECTALFASFQCVDAVLDSDYWSW